MAEAPTGVDVGQVAALFNLTPRRVQQLAKEGVIPKPERGRYQLAGCTRGYIAFLQRSLDSAHAKAIQPMVADLAQQRTRKTAAEAELAEIEVAKARGDVVAIADYESALSRILDRLTARLRAMPVRLAHLGDAVEVETEHEVERIIVELNAWDEDVIEPNDEPEQREAA